MRRLLFALCAVLSLIVSKSNKACAQTMPIDTAGFQTFLHQTGDTTYLMKQYFMCFLKKGPKRDQGPDEAAEIQQKHLKPKPKYPLSFNQIILVQENS